ncbi:hypothetical protein, partial [Fusobacterium ulcerans]|uniref:hypothetical protein n=1 Tax=Fusobacterium ulcerans TaxID=861 RepID=UPI0026EBEB76
MSENIRFYLNLQMVADEMQSEIPDCVFVPGEDETCLRGVCFYRKGIHLEKQYVYIIREQDIKGETVPKTHCSLIILGKIPGKWLSSRHTLLGLPVETDLLDLMNLCQ